MNRQESKRVAVGIWLTLIFTMIAASLLLFWKEQTATKEPYRIVCVMKKLDSANGFWTALLEGANLGAQELGAELEVTGVSTEDDISGQITRIRNGIRQKPDAMLVAPGDYSALTDVLQEVRDAGIHLILIDSVVDKDVADGIVATDNYTAGEQLGRFLAGKADDTMQIGIVAHVQGSSTAIEREQGIRDGLGQYEERIQDVVFCDSFYDKAYEVTKEMLAEHPGINWVVGTNEYAAVGAARAIEDLGLGGKVRMVGVDNSVEEIQFLEKGVFDGLLIQKPFNMGYLAVEQAVKSIEGKQIEKNLDSGCKMITRENMYTEENQRLLYPFSGSQ